MFLIQTVRNKFASLGTLVSELVDVLSISETKIDSSFPTAQFQLVNFKKPYRLDKSSTSEGLLTFVRNDIPSRQLTDFSFPGDIQILPVELNLKKSKWLILNIYRNPRQNITYFLDCLSEAIIFYSEYDSILINGDFNLEPETLEISQFLTLHNFHNHMKEKTCWKAKDGNRIDLIISNRKHFLMHTDTFETGLSDHHLLIYSMLKTTYEKLPPKVVRFR